jgi:hypothetical protein
MGQRSVDAVWERAMTSGSGESTPASETAYDRRPDSGAGSLAVNGAVSSAEKSGIAAAATAVGAFVGRIWEAGGPVPPRVAPTDVEDRAHYGQVL